MSGPLSLTLLVAGIASPFVVAVLIGRHARFEARFRAAVLDNLRDGECTGRMLRTKIWINQRINLSVPAFYHHMAKLEDEGLVVGEDIVSPTERIDVNVRHYRLA